MTEKEELKGKELIKAVGRFCYSYRKEVLNLTLKELSVLCEINEKTLSAFENGNANNIGHLFCYYRNSDADQKEYFSLMLFDLVGEF